MYCYIIYESQVYDFKNMVYDSKPIPDIGSPKATPNYNLKLDRHF